MNKIASVVIRPAPVVASTLISILLTWPTLALAEPLENAAELKKIVSEQCAAGVLGKDECTYFLNCIEFPSVCGITETPAQSESTLQSSSQLSAQLASPTGAGGAAAMAMHTGNDVAYGYDELNRLVRVVSYTSDVTFSYDGVGNRTAVVVPEPAGFLPIALSSLMLVYLNANRRRKTRRQSRLSASSRSFLAFCLLSMSFSVANPISAQNLPGFKMADMPDPALFFAGASSSSASAASSATATHPGISTEITPEIQELADALGAADAIYEYVYTQIEFNPIWGSHKGAMGTLLDGEGNDFDQASLMIALLRAVGLRGAGATFVYGQLNYSPEEITDWVGIPNDAQALSRWISDSGRDPTRSFINGAVLPGGGYTSVTLERVWVRIDNPVHVISLYLWADPAFKLHTATSGINVQLAMQYSRSSLIAAGLGGATVTADSVRNVSEVNLEILLNRYASNLSNVIRTNHPGSTIDDIIGGRSIIALTNAFSDSPLPNENAIFQVWETDIPAAYRACLRVALPGFDETFNTDAITGKRLTIFYESNQPVLRLDGVTIATGSTVGAGSPQTLQIEAIHPFFGAGVNQNGTMSINAGGLYLVLNGWTGTREGRVRHHERRERQNTFDGGALISEPVLGESLAVFAASWLAQVTETCELASKLADAHCFAYHRVGIAGQFGGPFVDIPFFTMNVVSNTNDIAVEGSVFFATSGHSSVLEGGVIEQIQPTARAVSTVSLAGIANDNSTVFFDATAANFPSIIPQLTNYDGSELDSVQSFVDAGARVILPQDGNLVVDDWSGTGFLSVNDTPGGGRSLGYIISGGLNGGFATTNYTLDVETLYQPPVISHNVSADPIDLVTGDFLYDETDLTVGSQPFPFSLAFEKSYNSGSRLNDGSLGLGWTHGFEMSATAGTNGYQAFGQDSPIDAVAAIVEMVVSLDLLSGGETAGELIIAMLAQRWFMEQLTNNIVTIEEATRTSVFLRLPDGTYNPPPGVASDLSDLASGGSYALSTKHGTLFSFRLDGEIDNSVDPNGNLVIWSYNSGILQSVSDAAGHTLSLTYSLGRISSVSDGSRSFSYGYDADGNLTTVTDAENEITTFDYAADGPLVRIFKPANPGTFKVQNTYSELDHVTRQRDANGVWWFYGITGHRSVENSSESKTSYYDKRGRTVRDISLSGDETTIEYDGENRVVRRTQPEANYAEFEYDDQHNLTETTLFPKPGSALAPIVSEFAYEPNFNRISTETDPRLNVTRYFYDSDGNLERVEQPQVGGQTPETSFTYNGRGQILTTTDPEGTVTAFTYDPVTADPLTTTADVGGFALTTTRTFNAAGDRISETDPRGNTTLFDFDNMRRVKQTTSPAPFNHVTLFTYDEDGNLTQISRETGDATMPWQTTSMTYTGSGKIETSTDPELQTTTTAYNSRDRVDQVTDAMGQVTNIDQDDDRLSEITDATGTISATYTYTANGKVADVTDANGNTTGYRYDGFDRLEFTDFPNTDSEQIIYDSASNPIELRARSGQSITFSYDALNRLETKIPSGSPSVTYNYDRAGRLLDVTDGAGLTTFVYDALGRISSVVHPGGETVGYEFDDSGNRSKLTYPDSHFVTYEYDEMNRLQRIADLGTTSIAFFTYDSLSRLVTTNRLNNASTTFTYEIDDDVESISHLFNGGINADFSYAYNAVHNRTTTSPSDPQFVFNFLAPMTANYANNNMNQNTSVTIDPEGGGQGIAFSFGYDMNGNLSSGLNPNSYPYDVENRLIGATTPDDSISYTYDAFGTRTSKTVDGVVTNYILDGGQVIAEYDGSEQLLRRYVYAGLDQPIQMTTPSATYYYHADALGSVIALSDAGANQVETYAFGPFGQVNQPSALGNPYLYTGREYDAETGLYYYRNRYYDPELGRFLQPDPGGFADGLHLYAYVNSNPVNLVDPLGLFSVPSSQSGQDFFTTGVLGGGTGVLGRSGVDGSGFLGVTFGRSETGNFGITKTSGGVSLTTEFGDFQRGGSGRDSPIQGAEFDFDAIPFVIRGGPEALFSPDLVTFDISLGVGTIKLFTSGGKLVGGAGIVGFGLGFSRVEGGFNPIFVRNSPLE